MKDKRANPNNSWSVHWSSVHDIAQHKADGTVGKSAISDLQEMVAYQNPTCEKSVKWGFYEIKFYFSLWQLLTICL